ncbi:Ankyrin repeat-containing domain protein [Lactarius tabidus]
MSSISFQTIFDTALSDYSEQVGIDLATHPLAESLRSCGSPDDVLKLLEDKAKEFKDFRDGNRKLLNCLHPVVQVVHTLSTVLGASIALVPFEPAKAIFAGVDVLVAAASGVSSSYDALVELFECLGNFLKRIRIYSDIPLTPSMAEISAKIMVELLSVLALATKQVKQGRISKWIHLFDIQRLIVCAEKFAKKLLGESEIERVLRRLDRLTQEEGRMTIAQTLEVVYGLVKNVKVVISGTQKPLASNRRSQSRSWLTPPDPSPNYNIACEIHQDGTAMWFCGGSVFTEWNANGSLLWIHGKPGAGKTILMSTIIREIDRMRKAGLALMAYFFFDFRDTQKQHRRDLLSSLLFQLSARSDTCHHIFSRFYLDHDEGAQQPSDGALSKCLTDMLSVGGQPPAYIIIDALDESPNISGMPSAREKVLQFLEDLVGSQLPNVHICVSSRTEIDIWTILEPLAQFRVSLHEESGQMADISGYIKSVVHSDRNMRRWTADNKQRVIETLSEKADGMFRWVYCLLDILRRCFPASIPSILEHLPETLDETYEHTLRRIDKVKRQFAHRLFQCLAVSARPLRVEELAEILAVRFDEGAFPQFNTGWRLGDAEEAVLSACGSLIAVVNVDGARIVQFAHFSVKEFLTSDRLSSASEDLSHYHIVPHMAHSILAQSSLSVLLQLDDRIDKDSISNFPLSDYAARYWFVHSQIENVSSTIRDATERLFDREEPHFAAWVWMASLLLRCGADVNVLVDNEGWSPLHRASYYGRIDIAQFLLEHCADVNLPGYRHFTPLALACNSDNLEISRLLVQHGADVNSRNGNYRTPLMFVKENLDIARLLIDNGADMNSANSEGQTVLHLAARLDRLHIAKLVLECGADFNICDEDGQTPLDIATEQGNHDVADILSSYMAGAISLDGAINSTPSLFTASENGQLNIVRSLLDGGSDVNATYRNRMTALHAASYKGHLEVANLLIDRGAYLDSRSRAGWTPLHYALRESHLEVTRLLLDHGANINAKTRNDGNALHVTLYLDKEFSRSEAIQLLLDRGVDVDVRNSRGRTARQLKEKPEYLIGDNCGKLSLVLCN